jgi:hypothetical protein
LTDALTLSPKKKKKKTDVLTKEWEKQWRNQLHPAAIVHSSLLSLV